MSIEFTDRYQALGIPYPEVSTMCRGHCEGTGFYPEQDSTNPLWQSEHAKSHTLKAAVKVLWQHKELWFWKSVLREVITGKYFKCDGWHFVKCPDCNGTGKRNDNP